MRILISMNGSNSMSCLPRILIVVMSLVSTTSFAGPGKQDEMEITIEFLEFLSEWETEQGEWLGPDGFIDDTFDQFYETDNEGTEDETQQ